MTAGLWGRLYLPVSQGSLPDYTHNGLNTREYTSAAAHQRNEASGAPGHAQGSRQRRGLTRHAVGIAEGAEVLLPQRVEAGALAAGLAAHGAFPDLGQAVPVQDEGPLHCLQKGQS